MEEEILKQKRLRVIRSELKNESFFKTLKKTGRYKEVFSGKEAGASLLITLLLYLFLTILFFKDNVVFLEYIPPLLVSIITGFITLIALSLSAFALVISSFNRQSFLALILFDEDDKLVPQSQSLINKMITILYRFYFAAGFNVISVFLLIFIYVYIIFPSMFLIGVSLALGFLALYLVVFSLIFTLTLFSTCIKLPFYF